jgi:hypothetical protein
LKPRPRERFVAEVRTATSVAEKLEDALRERVRGDVRFSNGDRALYATDASNYRAIPIGVVLPRDADDVSAAKGRGFLIAEFAGDSPDEARDRAREVAQHLKSLRNARTHRDKIPAAGTLASEAR